MLGIWNAYISKAQSDSVSVIQQRITYQIILKIFNRCDVISREIERTQLRELNQKTKTNAFKKWLIKT